MNDFCEFRMLVSIICAVVAVASLIGCCILLRATVNSNKKLTDLYLNHTKITGQSDKALREIINSIANRTN